MAVDKEIYAEVFETCDWDMWCQQFIKEDGKSNVDSVPAEREAETRE